MKLVIDLPEQDYELARKYPDVLFGSYGRAIAKGTPLPKWHGRLIDADKLKVELECGIRAGNYEEGYEKYAHINNMDDCVDAVEYADTIIEADRGE